MTNQRPALRGILTKPGALLTGTVAAATLLAVRADLRAATGAPATGPGTEVASKGYRLTPERARLDMSRLLMSIEDDHSYDGDPQLNRTTGVIPTHVHTTVEEMCAAVEVEFKAASALLT